MLWQIVSAKTHVQRDDLPFQLSWATAQLLVSCVSPTYLVDEFISSLQVLLGNGRRIHEHLDKLRELKCLQGYSKTLWIGI